MNECRGGPGRGGRGRGRPRRWQPQRRGGPPRQGMRKPRTGAGPTALASPPKWGRARSRKERTVREEGEMVKINHSPYARTSRLSQPRSSALLEPRRRLLSGARGSPGPGAGQRRQPDREPLRTCPCGGAATSQAAAAAAAAVRSWEGK